MAWLQTKLGAGGFLRNINIAPDGTKVVRTDSYGAYVYDPALPNPGNAGGTGAWRQVIHDNISPDYSTNLFAMAVYEIVVAPSNTSRFYMISGNGLGWRSDDKGVTWTELSAFAQDSNVNVTNTYHTMIAVDPQNADIVLFGCTTGAFYSIDAGLHFTNVSSIAAPSGAPGGTGVTFSFDPSSSVSGGATQGIYAASYGNGVYHTSTGVSGTWSLTNAHAGMPLDMRDIRVGIDGEVWLLQETGGGSACNVSRYLTGTSTWTNLENLPNNYNSIEADPNSADNVYIGGPGTIVYTNNGTNSSPAWTSTIYGGATRVATDIPWLAQTFESFMTCGAMRIDPTSGLLWFAEGIGVWTCTPPSGGSTSGPVWVSVSTAIEQLVTTVVLAPPGGAPIYVVWDRVAFALPDLTKYPLNNLALTAEGSESQAGLPTGFSGDYASLNPSTIVVLANNYNVEGSVVSNDGGATWALWGSFPPGEGGDGTHGGPGGCIAAQSALNWVMVRTENGSLNPDQPYYTHDGGNTWNICTFSGGSAPPVYPPNGWPSNYYYNQQIFCSDRVDGTFAIFNNGTGIWTSPDGATFTNVYSSTPGGGAGVQVRMKSVPGQQGHLFFTCGIGLTNNLQRSANYGASWSSVANVTAVYCVGFGATALGQSYPAVFIVGSVSGVHGIYVSYDNCVTWNSLGANPLNSIDNVVDITGSQSIIGQAYIGFGGSGAAIYTLGSHLCNTTVISTQYNVSL